MSIPSKTHLFIDGLKNSPNKGSRPLFLDDTDAICAKWKNLTLSSVFQPIFKSSDLSKPFAYEAFVRSIDSAGNQIGADELFTKATDQDEITGLDRLCRTMHLLNFILQDIVGALLFLNVNEGLISAVDTNHGAAFRKVIDALGFSPNRIVIELPVSLVKDTKRIHFVLQNYRLNSLEVAINIQSISDLKALSERANIHYIKIARPFLSSDKALYEELNQINQLSKQTNTIIAQNKVALNSIDDPKVMLQGDAYGIPSTLKE
jgi:EAL domain-containing protein (putative c-di-GMP-specific phosphodiesterase class I)